MPDTAISTFATATPASGDLLLGSDVSATNATANFTVAALLTFIESNIGTAQFRALLDDAAASDQRTTLGLGTIATQAASSVSITGGSITGITDLAVADGGTGASTAATARTNIGAATAVPEGRAKFSTTTYLTVPGVDLQGVGTKALNGTRLQYEPMFVSTQITLDQLAVEVTTASAASTTMRLGIYNADTDWQPTSLVLDAGTVATDSTGVKTISISQTLSPGRYLLAFNSDGTPTLRAYRGGGRYLGVVPTMGGTPFPASFYVAAAYAALASTGVAWTTSLAGTAGFDHLILVRVSTP